MVAAAGVDLDTTEFDLGAARYLRDGTVLSDETLEELRATTPSSSEPSGRRSATPPSRRARSSVASCSSSASSSTSTSTCAPSAACPDRSPRGRTSS